MIQPLSPASLRPFWTALRRHVAINNRNDLVAFGDRKAAPRIGLCVSGGPDSMALAFLLSKLLKASPEGSSSLHAFIIDHNAREGSRQEANEVSEWMKGMGIACSVERISWPTPDPLSMSNFESEARKRRYGALVRMAIERDVRHLLTGHHLDDQIETILMRLVRAENPSLLALRGMQFTTSIPECESIRGVRNAEPSVPMDTLFRQDANLSPSPIPPYLMALHESRLGKKLETLDGMIKGLEHGGMELHRPLLGYHKSALVATCEANGIPYVKDKTNFDPSFTRRNAIRVLRSKYRLPRALQDKSLLGLAGIARDTREVISDRALEALRGISVLAFDFRSGTVHLRIPVGLSGLVMDDNNVAAYLMSKLSSLVSAEVADEHHTLAPGSIVSLLWRSLRDPFWSSSINLNPPRFTYNSVLFEGLKPPKLIAGTSTIWRLSRAPMTQKERHVSTVKGNSQMGFKPKTSKNLVSRWLLWDRRYWIQIRVNVKNSEMARSNLPTFLHLIGIRAYMAEDSALLKARMSEQSWKVLRDTLHECAGGKIRYTLPVLTYNDQVIAFPTLSRYLISPKTFSDQTKAFGFGEGASLQWSVAYKLLPRNISQWGSAVSSTLVVPPAVRQIQNSRGSLYELNVAMQAVHQTQTKRGDFVDLGANVEPQDHAQGQIHSKHPLASETSHSLSIPKRSRGAYG